ncbi:DUF4303 domain-containing protein [Actinomadura miaoliensis]|uniref:DUF4303 domain-containing protein n=1 Tax=Actinomadura miaoliensis TaxID=430685 RepID=A0ABP7VPM0_9ACTN
MSFEDLVTRLADAARAAFTEVRREHPGESFYCFGLYTDAFAAYVLPTCNRRVGRDVDAGPPVNLWTINAG